MSELGDLIRAAIAQIVEASQDETKQSQAIQDLLTQLAARAIENSNMGLEQARHNHREFAGRNEVRWQAGFDALETLIGVCLEAGIEFQREFLAHYELQTDILLGVLMRIHARSCRVASEIFTLMKNGYADGALSRWRTLHELAVSSLAIAKLGKPAAIDYFISGKVKAFEGMREYQLCAERMGYVPYTDAEMLDAQQRVESLLKSHGRKAQDYSSNFGWARPHINSGHFDKLQEFVDLGHWSHDYAWASQDVHAGYRELRAQLAMGDATEDLLLAGASDAGMTDPGHRTAISLSQVTSAFLSVYIQEETNPLDRSMLIFWMTLIDQLTAQVGASFLCGEKLVATNAGSQ